MTSSKDKKISSKNEDDEDEIKKSVIKSVSRFFKIVDVHSDEITILLRAHLFIENQIDELISSSLPRGDVLSDFSFSQKILILKSLDIFSNKVIDSLSNLNKIRNHCSHGLDYNITQNDVELIGRPFGKEYGQIKSKNSGDTDKEMLIKVLTLLLFSQIFSKSYLALSNSHG